jgi:hypothetical protein
LYLPQVTAENLMPGFRRTPLSVNLETMRNATALDRQRMAEVSLSDA